MKRDYYMKSTANKRGVLGFTLIELMITIAVIAILASIAMPIFRDQIQKARRSDAKQALLEVANRQELFFSNCNTYVTNTAGLTRAGGCCTAGTCGLGLADTLSPEGGFYTISVAGNSTSFTVTATRINTLSQVDDKCGDFTLTETGVRGVVNNTAGWNAQRCW